MISRSSFRGLLPMERQLACRASVYERCVLTDEEVDKVVAHLQKYHEKLLAERPIWKSVTIGKSYWPNGNVCIKMGNYEVLGIVEKLWDMRDYDYGQGVALPMGNECGECANFRNGPEYDYCLLSGERTECCDTACEDFEGAE